VRVVCSHNYPESNPQAQYYIVVSGLPVSTYVSNYLIQSTIFRKTIMNRKF